MSLPIIHDIGKTFNALICVYKPADVSVIFLLKRLKQIICNGLNECVTPSINYMDINENESGISVNIRPSYADNVLVSGPKFTESDFSLACTHIEQRTSGVCLVGVNRDISYIRYFKNDVQLKILRVEGKLGEATRFFYKDDKVVAKAKYNKVTQTTIDKIMNSFQAAHQRKIFCDLGVGIQSQEAYELAAKGLIKPMKNGITAIYSIRCVTFKPPYFILEIACANENENYLLQFIHDCGLQLRTLCHCTGIRCLRYGPFTVANSLLFKECSLTNIINNSKKCKEIFKNYRHQISSQSPLERSTYSNVENSIPSKI